MSETFRVGDIVECVDAKPRFHPGFGSLDPAGALTEGGLYTVTGLCGPDAFGETGVTLRETAPPNSRSPGFVGWRFRLIHRPRAEFLTELCGARVNLPRETEAA